LPMCTVLQYKDNNFTAKQEIEIKECLKQKILSR
jgi:hypothetical protein